MQRGGIEDVWEARADPGSVLSWSEMAKTPRRARSVVAWGVSVVLARWLQGLGEGVGAASG